MLEERYEQGGNKHNHFLSSQDRAKGFAIETDRYNNVTLLKRNEPLAWFSGIISKEAVDVFIEIIKDYESGMNKQRPKTARERSPNKGEH